MSTAGDNQATGTREEAEFVGKILRGEFRIDAPLGEGGMSRVYRAHQLSVDRDVVVKVMTVPSTGADEWQTRFMQEARAASKVSHPGVVTIYSFGEEDGVGPFIAMELVEGRSLRSLAGPGDPMKPGRAAQIMAQVCRAMHAAHQAGVVHRDLKPDNIMVEERDGKEVARVLDFGIAKPSDSVVETREDHVMGTPDYMAPEQARQNPVDARTDVYSAGIILYELLFGKRPFTAPEPLSLMFKHVNEPLPLEGFDDAWPRELRDVLERACAKDPRDRYDSAREMAAALDAVEPSTDDVTDDGDPGRAGVSSADIVLPVDTGGNTALAHTTADGEEPAPTLVTSVVDESQWSRAPYVVLTVAIGIVLVTIWISTPGDDHDVRPAEGPTAPRVEGAALQPSELESLERSEPADPLALVVATKARAEIRAARERAAGTADGVASGVLEAADPEDIPTAERPRRPETASRRDDAEEPDEFHRVGEPERKLPEMLVPEFEDD